MNYDEAVGRLTALGEAPDPDLLDRTVEPLELAMRTDDPQGYAWFVIAVCDQLNSRDLGDWRRQDELVGKYARLGLRHATVLPPAAELRLLEHVVAVPAQERRGVARRWLSVLGRLEREIDPTFDPADVPLLNVPVPGDGLPPGVAEEHVQDPALRQRYARAVSENRAHAARYAGQVEVRELLSRYRPVAQRFLVASYGQDPDRTKELDELLAEHAIAKDWAEAIRVAVQQQRRG
jgi:hypothetical protein